MRIGFIQMAVRFGHVTENHAKAAHLLEQADADLFVLPELFSSGYFFQSHEELELLSEPTEGGPTVAFLSEFAAAKKCHIVAGFPEKATDRYYNSAMLVGPNGFIAVYRKVHLFDTEKQWFAPGDTPFAVVDIGPAKVGMMICFDWMFPESMRSLALLGAEIVCHPANLVMPYCQRAMVTRCLENNLFAITANRIGADERGGERIAFTGSSQITGPQGSVLATASARREEVAVVDINVEKARQKMINSRNHLLEDRRPDMYSL